MAPHINPRAIEYGIVLRGAGTIQIVYPNGSLAMNAKVTEGNVFWIPRYFPFCQIASRTGPFEFFGFTTSARNNRPQFLVGANSLLHTLRGPEFAAAFGLSEDRLNEIINAQRESTILPSATVAPPEEAALAKLHREEVAKVMSSFGSEMVMGLGVEYSLVCHSIFELVFLNCCVCFWEFWVDFVLAGVVHPRKL
ncbi:UNVERIFIED_CONTAM: Vicilin-like seed storage protein [Sesamum radiatum]|uniref:Vicilin-like seed storage protein n=1 Tax=Sesamum radiatum TaxID=300843 RepID=A0AAW2W807_SESRA